MRCSKNQKQKLVRSGQKNPPTVKARRIAHRYYIKCVAKQKIAGW